MYFLFITKNAKMWVLNTKKTLFNLLLCFSVLFVCCTTYMTIFPVCLSGRGEEWDPGDEPAEPRQPHPAVRRLWVAPWHHSGHGIVSQKAFRHAGVLHVSTTYLQAFFPPAPQCGGRGAIRPHHWRELQPDGAGHSAVYTADLWRAAVHA